MEFEGFDYKKLRRELISIQKVCTNATDCIQCPFGNEIGDCKIIHYPCPADWEIADEIDVSQYLLKHESGRAI